ncbi:MAG: FG-GAP-like repeat-containing protein, partial [Candidatus Azobacteroides sp.]|nr:FG-GAP-like repeat-containing protein [Candidatus Azobacteroides sp.]
MSMPIVADLYGTGVVNMIFGNYIYTANADLSGVTLVNKITPAINPSDPDAPSGTLPAMPDGGRVCVVDIDNDGKLDLVISLVSGNNTFIYIADPETGVIKASKYIPEAGFSSYPFVGDIDGDGYPEIVFIKNPSTSEHNEHSVILAYKYVPDNLILQEFWRLSHTDTSGATGITLFDFNQDGISELVYRDENYLRIINGSGIHHETGLPCAPYDLASFICTSGTGTEYPIIADVDGDGQAEIIIVGGENKTTDKYWLGYLCIFKSEFPDTSPWAPARRVWNQYAFNPVNINEDLTVPRYPLSPATE